MCGIAGFWDQSKRMGAARLTELAVSMANALHHRGPDDCGDWVDTSAGIAMGHRRLSIVDLSPAGRQPMVSADGRMVLVYNGEIYNFGELRRELEQAGRGFRGESDTEVLLEGIAHWGLARTVPRLIGMFSLAVWDRRARSLTLVRDRLGIKPLYWARFGTLFLFGSELKALRRHPGWSPEVDRNALAAYVRHCYVPTPHSIYKGVTKLEPGYLLTIGDGATVERQRYWELPAEPAAPGPRPGPGTSSRRRDDDEVVTQLDELLRDAVRRRMVADVPLGAFLSGGVDSSTVAALMQAQSPRPIRTFSIGFSERDYDEARFAKAVATHLGTDHTELHVSSSDALDVIPHLSQWYDEPFGDSSQVPTYLVSEMTRRHVTVALSGDGGDELFAGYNRYRWAGALWRSSAWAPLRARRGLARALQAVPPTVWDFAFRGVPRSRRPVLPSDKMRKLSELLVHESTGALYRGLVSQWHRPDELVVDANEPRGLIWDDTLAERIPDLASRMRYLDLHTYLPDDLLTKLDRASMAVSLEARVPLLDHRVVEFAWRLGRNLLVRRGQSKWLLRQVLYRYVPRRLIERPKMGFGVPLDAWLRGPLREWAEELLSVRRLRREGFLNPSPIRKKWEEHGSRRRNWQYHLWTILMFQAWLEGSGV